MSTATAPPETATNAELIRWVFDVLNTHDIAPLKQYWTESTRERFPNAMCVGPEQIGAYFEAAFAAVPDFRIEIIGLAAQDDDVFVQWRITGTHSGAPWQGIEPTGRSVELDGIDHFVVRDGKVDSNFVVFDQLQFARRIGMMPADGSTADGALKAAFNAKTRLLERIKRCAPTTTNSGTVARSYSSRKRAASRTGSRRARNLGRQPAPIGWSPGRPAVHMSLEPADEKPVSSEGAAPDQA